jgi:pimeloyl-ACP methyl ester carboxylesterase
MPRRAALTITLLACASATVPAAAGAKIAKGPAGKAFYSPPAKVVKGTHGSVIWARKLSGAPVLKGASANELLLYTSKSLAGKTIPVSGTVALPKGKAPKGGWPVVTFAHGTTGIADSCAPSRDTGKAPLTGYNTYIFPLLQSWLKKGYAVVRTDYEGLGTPGPHPYLIGTSEGRGVLDMVRAAHAYNGKISEKKVIISGHSQGGHAALWATALAPKWTPDLKIRGTVAFAPASQIGTQAAVIKSLGKGYEGLSGLAAMIIRGVDIASPGTHVSGIFNAKGKALYPQTLTKCLADLGKPTSFGGAAPKDYIRPDADVAPTLAAIKKYIDPQSLTIKTPLLIEQGLKDTTVLPALTGITVGDYRKRGIKVTYNTYKGLDHGGVTTAKAPQADATAYIAARLK